MIDLIGQKFGRLLVLQRVDNNRWLCKCDCGNKKIIRGDSLKNGKTKSCGCLNIDKIKERFTKHGHRSKYKTSKIYYVWRNMIQRCTNPNFKQYKDYGGRGITVCEEWLHSFPNFLRDNPGWKPGLTLERDKNELGYFPGNCYWATWKEQQRNKRNNHLITCFGKTQCAAAWSEETGIPESTIRWRLRQGWSPEKALTTFFYKIIENRGREHNTNDYRRE